MRFCPILGGIMNSKNIKVVDEHNIDRNANVLFAFELDGTGYVSYAIDRDAENGNIFLSKVIRNLDGTFSLLDIDDSNEKVKLTEAVKTIITTSVESQDDKLIGDVLTLSDGKVVKFIAVSFNKEQRINVQKTYITTVKKEVIKVVEKYYDISFVVSQPTPVESIFPTVPTETPFVNDVFPEVPVQTVPEQPVVVEPITVPTPEPVVEPVVVSTPIVENVQPPVQEVVQPVVEPAPAVVPPVVPSQPVVEPVLVAPVPEPATVLEPVNTPLVFNAVQETNLNAALGEVANSATIPVENIEPVREFGVDAPVQQPVIPPIVNPSTPPVLDNAQAVAPEVAKKAGFANSKFFMVVAIAFFLASCVFLGYEVFNYFQLTK